MKENRLHIWGSKVSLIHRESREQYATVYQKVNKHDLKEVNRAYGWNGFDWISYLDDDQFTVYKLMVQGDPNIQGLICLESKEGWIEVHLVESAPWNIGSTQQEFIGIGPYLFAMACKQSFDLGYDGYVALHAKTKLIPYYERTLGAFLANDRTRRMIIDTKHAYHLIQTHLE